MIPRGFPCLEAQNDWTRIMDDNNDVPQAAG